MINDPAAKMKQLLGDFQSKKITMQELDTECAYWYLDCFAEIHRRPTPTTPSRYQEYLNSSHDEKKNYNKNFWGLPDIKTYLNEKEYIEQEHKDFIFHLEKWKALIPEGDVLAHTKFFEKICEFK